MQTMGEYNVELVKHLNMLLEIAKKGQPADILAKIERYYKGNFSTLKDKTVNQRNVINGIVETKATLVIDSQLKTAIIPQTKSMATADSLQSMNQIAGIIDDCIQDVFKKNNFDTWRQSSVRNLVKRLCVAEIYWDAEQNEIALRNVPFNRFFPDPSCKEISSANYIFIEEYFSPITLKSKYPQLADKIDKAKNEETKDGDRGEPKGVVNTSINGNGSQVFAYNDPKSVIKNAKDIKVWKCYMKDDATFTAEEATAQGAEEAQNLEGMNKYPNGRMILFVDGQKDLILEDKPLDYKFGFPIEVCYNIEGETVWDGSGDVEPLFENQDRINNAYSKSQEMIGKLVAYIVNDPRNGIKKSDFVNKTVLEGENLKQWGLPEVISNNTMEKFNMMIDYMEMLKKDSLDIARLNEQMVSGNQDDNTRSGEQVRALNESPMSGIRALQRNYKDFLIRVTNKVIMLIQQYYNTPRMIRCAQGNSYIRIPAKGATELDQNSQPQAQQIEMYKKNEENGKIELVNKIKGDLQLGRYEVDVIGGSEKPRSKSENAAIMFQMYKEGMIGQGDSVIQTLLEEYDIPNRNLIMQNLQAQPKPTIFDSADMAKSMADLLKELDGFTTAKRAVLKNFGLPDKPDTLQDVPVQEVTKQSEVAQVVEIAPVLISDDPMQQQQAISIAQNQQAQQQAMEQAKMENMSNKANVKPK